MEIDHLADVHPVDVIGAEDHHQVRAMLLDQVDVLVDGVRGALEPVAAAHHLRRHHGDELLLQQGRDGPGLAHMLDQGLGLVLDQQIDGLDLGIDQIAEHEIDDAVARPEGHEGLESRRGQGLQARPWPPAMTKANIRSCLIAVGPWFQSSMPRAASAASNACRDAFTTLLHPTSCRDSAGFPYGISMRSTESFVSALGEDRLDS